MPKCPPQGKRQAQQLQEQKHAHDEQSPPPRFAPVHVPHEHGEGSQSAANGHRQPDQRIEERRPTPEPHSSDRVVGRALLLGERDLAGELGGHTVAIGAHRVDLPGGEPQARGCLRRDGGGEQPA